ncbi:MAG: type IV toxin-antitoxin system AbiEi family antitoxin [Acidimicrobiia bacterium]
MPAAEFVDPMMRHLDHAYYVGLLSAAEIHGFAHQRPQVFQVVVDARLRARQFGRVAMSFISSRRVTERSVVRRNTPTGQLTVSTIETTLFDMASMPVHAGGLSNVATVIVEMFEDGVVHPDGLTEAASTYPVAVRQRLGWMVETLARDAGADVRLDGLAAGLGNASIVLLTPSQPAHGDVDARWRVRANVELEPDV